MPASNGWWGTMTLIATEGALFAYLLFSYYYMALHYGRDWLPAELPSFRLSGPSTLILITSSVTAWSGEHALKHDRAGRCAGWLGVSFVLGAVFVGIQLREWMDKPFRPTRTPTARSTSRSPASTWRTSWPGC